MSGKLITGLEDVVVTTSSICFLNEKKNTVEIRGYDLLDLAEHSNFEEVCYLLWNGKLPTAEELDQFSKSMTRERHLPNGLLDLIRRSPKAPVMDGLRTWVSALSAYDPEPEDNSIDATRRKALRITAKMPTIAAAVYRIGQSLEDIAPDPKLGHAQNFLYMVLGKPVQNFISRVFEKSMILYSEHELNASTFSARVASSTLSDIYSGITAAIGTLKGPLHGGANEEAMKLLLSIGAPDKAVEYVGKLLSEKKRIMGFGHRIYKTGDPRVKLMKAISKETGEKTGQSVWHEICEKVEQFMMSEKRLYPNLDFYSGPAYYSMGIPVQLYTAVFACSRIAGWVAHVMEQFQNNRLIRPRAEYTGPSGLAYVTIDKRS